MRDDADAPQLSRQLVLPAVVMSLVAPGLGHVVMGLTARGLSWLVSYIAFALLVGAERPLALVAVVVAAAGDAIVMGASLPDGRAADADGD